METKRDNRRQWKVLQPHLESESPGVILKLLRDLYSLNQENRDFLHARFLNTTDGLEPYKQLIDDAVYPDIYRNKPIRISAGKKAISQYKNATKDELGVLELMVYFVERGNQFTVDYGDIDDSFYSALENMFDRILKQLKRGGPALSDRFLPRLIAIRDSSSCIGWGYHDYLREALGQAFPYAD